MLILNNILSTITRKNHLCFFYFRIFTKILSVVCRVFLPQLLIKPKDIHQVPLVY